MIREKGYDKGIGTKSLKGVFEFKVYFDVQNFSKCSITGSEILLKIKFNKMP